MLKRAHIIQESGSVHC